MKSLFMAAILFISPFAAAETYFMKTVTGKSSSEEAKSVARDLFESEISERGHDIVRDPRKAKYQVGLKVIRIGQSYIISATKRKNGKTLHADKMKADKIEEFDKVISRLASAVIRESKAKNNPKIGEITEKEKDLVVERTETKWYQAFGFGPAFLNNHGTAPNKMGYYIAWHKIAEVSPFYAIRLTLETTMVFNNLLGSDDNNKSSIDSFAAGNIGVNYFFTAGNIAPFVTAHLGFGGSFGSSIEDDAGFIWGGGAGVYFFRTATTQLSLTLSHSRLINSDLAENPGQTSLALAFHY